MSVIQRIKRLYRPVTKPNYVRYDMEVDTRSMLDADVPAEPEAQPEEKVHDVSPLESLLMEHYYKVSYRFHPNDVHHNPDKDHIPTDDKSDESLLKLRDMGSELDDNLKNDDDYRPQYVPSAVIDYFNENANGHKYIEKRKGPGGNYIWVDRAVVGRERDCGIMADDIVDNFITMDPMAVDISKFSGVKHAEDAVKYFLELLGKALSAHGGNTNQRTDGVTAGLYVMLRMFILLGTKGKKPTMDDFDGLIPFDLPPNEFKTWKDACIEGLLEASNAYKALFNAQGILIGESIASARIKDDPHVEMIMALSGELVDTYKAPSTRVYDFSKKGRGVAYVNATSNLVDLVKIKRLMNLCRKYDYVVMSHGGEMDGSWTIDPVYIDGHMCKDADSVIEAIHHMDPDASIAMCCCNPGAITPKDTKSVRYLPTNMLFESAARVLEEDYDVTDELRYMLKRLNKSYNAIMRVQQHLGKRARHPATFSHIDIDKLDVTVKTDAVRVASDWTSMIHTSLTDLYDRYSRGLMESISFIHMIDKGHVNESGYYWYESVLGSTSYMNLPGDRFSSLDECILNAAEYAQYDCGDMPDGIISIQHDSVEGACSLDYGDVIDEAVRILSERISSDLVGKLEPLFESGTETRKDFYPSSIPEYYNGSLNEAAMKAKQRNALDDSEFGLPRLRAYPLNDAKHVKAAIRMFNHCKDPEDQKTLASNIFKAMKKHGVDMKIGENNSLYRYAPQELKESAWPKMMVQAIGNPMAKRTKEDIVKEHLRINSDFYNNAFYGTEYASYIDQLDNMDFMEVFYPNIRSMNFGNRVHTCIGGCYNGDSYDASKNWFKVDLSKDADHRDYCMRLYKIMDRMLNDETFNPSTLAPEDMGVILDWYQRVSYHYGCLMDAESENVKHKEIQYLWDLFWNYNENPNDPHIKSINVIAFIAQMRSVVVNGKVASMNEDQLVGRTDLKSYLEKELGQSDAIYLLPKTKEFPVIDQTSVHLAMDKIGAVPAKNRREFASNLNRRYRELGCDFSISIDHPYVKYASDDIKKHVAHVLMEDQGSPIDDQSNSDEVKASHEAGPWIKRNDLIPGSNWHNILDNKEMGPNNLKQQRPDYQAGEALL